MINHPQLSSEEIDAIRSILASHQRRKSTLTLDYLLNRWSGFAIKVEEGYRLTIDDYTNDLSTRDLLQIILDGSQPTTREKLSSWLVEWDDRLKKATKEVIEPLLLSYEQGKKQGWWWFRIPLNQGTS